MSFGHLRCERARGNTEGLSLWVALNANGRILNSIQTLIPTGLRRRERLTAEANFIYQDQKASRHISEYIRLKKKKKTSDEVSRLMEEKKTAHETKKITKLNDHSEEKVKTVKLRTKKGCQVEDKSTPS